MSTALNQLSQSQPEAVRFFLQALHAARLSHAYLLKGHPALATPLVVALAQSIFCPQGGCLGCQICVSVAAENWPDFHLVRAAPEAKSPVLKLAQIKTLIQQVSLPPVQSKRQIFVIEHAENMNAESGNALLKTLEEPISESVIILISPYPARVLPTLRSRSQPVALRLSAVAEAGFPAEFWSWEQLEQITTTESQLKLYRYLESLSHPQLILQLQVFQRDCWHRMRVFLLQKASFALVRRARIYLETFEQTLEILAAHGNTKLALEFFCQDFVKLRRQQTERRR